jgi:hypothetical protein
VVCFDYCLCCRIEAPDPDHPEQTKLYRLKMEKAVEPSNVVYENLKYSSKNRICRRILTTIATYVIFSLIKVALTIFSLSTSLCYVVRLPFKELLVHSICLAV